MEDDTAVIYGLEFQARSLTAQHGEVDRICFLVGTQSLRAENQVHHIDFDDENNLINKTVFLHQEGEVWHINTSSFDPNLFSTCYNKSSVTKSELRAAVWRLPERLPPSPENEASNFVLPLEPVCHLNSDNYEIKSTLWHPTGDTHVVIGLSEDRIISWDLDVSSSHARLTDSIALECKGHPRLTCGSWNPHHNFDQIVTGNDSTIRGWDLRSKKQTYVIDGAHGQTVRDVDFNPNRQYYLASCGDDCRAKFWDIRNCSEPLKVLFDHSHWVWAVRYNQFHDQLVLTSSSDFRVILNRLVTLSSEPSGHFLDDDQEDSDCPNNSEGAHRSPPADAVIATYEEHEDSVYSVVWSTADPWVFASLSYDGRLVINKVPRAEKYKILL